MTPSDHTTSAALGRISRAMDRQPRFINVRTGGNLPRRDLLDATPPVIFIAFMACVVLFVVVDWLCARYLW